MKRFLLSFISAVVLACLPSTAQDWLGSESDSTSSTAIKSTSQILAEMQLQLQDMQLKLDSVNGYLASAPGNGTSKEIIPVEEKNNSRFFWSIQFGFFLKSDEYFEGESSKENLGVKFSYALKPAFGYIFNDRMTAGCKLVFADCQFSGMQTSASIKYIIANALIGGGVSMSDYITWRIQPYYRYRFTKLFWDRVNLWGEVSLYAGQNIPRDLQTRELKTGDISTIYGISLSPMITVDLNRNLMIFTTFDLLSWNGSYKMNGDRALNNNSFNFQFIPIYSILTGLFNIGLIRRF